MVTKVSTLGTHGQDYARGLWCPFARGWGEAGGGGNRRYDDNGAPDADCLCITHECMAWEWLDPEETSETSLGFCHLIVGGRRP